MIGTLLLLKILLFATKAVLNLNLFVFFNIHVVDGAYF